MKWISLLLALQLLPTVSYAMGGKGDHQKRAEHLQKELNLTNEQLEKVTAIRKKYRGDKDSKKALKEAKKAFRADMKNPKASKADLTAKFETFQNVRDAHQRKMFSMMLEMREILNSEQREKFAEMKKNEYKGEKREKKIKK